MIYNVEQARIAIPVTQCMTQNTGDLLREISSVSFREREHMRGAENTKCENLVTNGKDRHHQQADHLT